ncbi:MAG: (d)CMP kinase [Saprospiraceae bacterium]|nr:(d)CMP kinase [Saprospiraceae bacterium]
MNQIVIAIDGHSSCGKSTLAKQLAKELQYIYVDTGAMYRAVTLFFIENKVPLDQAEQVQSALHQINISFQPSPQGNQTILNGQNVEEQIRQMAVSEKVSDVAAISAVRKEMVAQQQRMGQEKGVVMDGRDIGTVVFPDAELKIFLTASIEERTRRRFEELKAKQTDITFEEVKNNLIKRDHIDSTRVDSPLKQANDAVLIDNTKLDRTEQLQLALDLVKQRL